MTLSSLVFILCVCTASLVCSVFLYLFCGKNEELGKNATHNTWATISVIFVNSSVSYYVGADIGVFLQGLYDSLRIPTLPADFWEGTPLWVGIVVGLIARDFMLFVVHWWMHTRWGWATHAGHHSDTHVNALTVFRIHPLEDIAILVFSIVMLSWMQLPEAIFAVHIIALIYGMYIHLDLDIDHGPLKYVLASPTFHRWHHADVPEAYGKNLSNFFPIFDVIFGTFYLPGKCDAPMGARSSGVEDKNPIAIVTFPFRNWTQEIGISLRSLRERRAAKRLDIAEPDVARFGK